MKKKTTLATEAYILYKDLVELCERTSQGDSCYQRLNRIRNKASDRWLRRSDKATKTGKDVIVNKVGRPSKPDRKMPINVKLPPSLIEWLDRQPESRAILIETALTGFYQIPDY